MKYVLMVKLMILTTLTPERSKKASIGIKYLNSVIVVICYKNFLNLRTIETQSDRVGLSKLAFSRTITSPLAEEIAIQVEHLNTMIFPVRLVVARNGLHRR